MVYQIFLKIKLVHTDLLKNNLKQEKLLLRKYKNWYYYLENERKMPQKTNNNKFKF